MPTANDTQLPFKEAIDFLSEKINIDTESWIEGAGLTQQVAFTVAGAKGSVLQEIREQVDRAINNGISIAEFAKQFDRIADSYVDNWQLKGDRAWRSQLIYEQNLRQAYGAGRYRQMTEPSTLKSRPYWQWVHGDTRVPRPTHLAMNGKVFPAGSLQCHIPAGFGCKCQIFSLSKRDVDREGLKVEDVSDFEADKGFNYLPGKLTKERRDELLKGLDPDIRKLVKSDGEAEFKLPEGITRRRNGVNYVLTNSRWRRADNQETVTRSRVERASDIYELTQQFEREMEDTASPETYESIAERFLHNLTQMGDRDRAEAEVAAMNIQGDDKELIANAVDFCQLLDKPTGVTSIAFGAERAFARVKTGQIGLEDGAGSKTTRIDQFHEMAHCIEVRQPGAMQESGDWVKAKATGEPRQLAELTGDDGYEADEMAYPGRFIHPYVGKIYPDGSTEVHSMGLQAFANPRDLVELYTIDPDHFRLMMRLIRK
jgi:hypothetical protein